MQREALGSAAIAYGAQLLGKRFERLVQSLSVQNRLGILPNIL